MTIRELLPMDIDVDMVDDVCEELYVAFCGPVELTDAGMEKFGEVLDYPIEMATDEPVCIVHIDDDNEKVWKDRLSKVKLFFWALAGYCLDDDYNRWFKVTEQ